MVDKWIARLCAITERLNQHSELLGRLYVLSTTPGDGDSVVDEISSLPDFQYFQYFSKRDFHVFHIVLAGKASNKTIKAKTIKALKKSIDLYKSLCDSCSNAIEQLETFCQLNFASVMVYLSSSDDAYRCSIYLRLIADKLSTSDISFQEIKAVILYIDMVYKIVSLNV